MVRMLAAAAVVGCGLFVAGHFLESLPLRLAGKPWIHLALIAWLLRRAGDPYARRLAAAFTACLVGDLVIELPTGFLAGAAGFLVGHALFVRAFLRDERRLRPLAALPFLAWAAGLWLFLLPGLGELALPLAIYALGLCATAWRACARLGRPGAGWAAAGAVVFVLSDSLIGLARFGHPFPGARLAIVGSYWLSLLLLARSARPDRPSADAC